MDQLILVFAVVLLSVIGVFGFGFVRQPEYRRLGAGSYLRMRLQGLADVGGNVADRDRGRSDRLIRRLCSQVLAESTKTSAGSFTLPGSVVVFAGVSDYGHLSGPAGESVVRAVNQQLAELPKVVGATQMVFQRDDVLTPGQLRVSVGSPAVAGSGAVGVVGPADGRATDVLVEEAPTKVDPDVLKRAAGISAGVAERPVTSHLEGASPQAFSVAAGQSAAGQSPASQFAAAKPASEPVSASVEEVVQGDHVAVWGVGAASDGEDTEEPGMGDTEPPHVRDEDTAQPGLGEESTARPGVDEEDTAQPGLGRASESAPLRAERPGEASGGSVAAGRVPATEVVPLAKVDADVSCVSDSKGSGGVAPETVPLRRWSLIGPDGQAYVLSSRGLVIGRSPECDVVTADVHASAQHAKFTLAASGVRVEDLGATNGVLVNHRVVHGSAAVAADDSVTIGQTIYRVESVGRTSGH